jgi:hypothetical protein
MNSFFVKYLKYKKKYSKIKKQVGGMRDETVKVKDKEITISFPDSYFCQITQELFVDPVTTVDGITIERSFIENWFQTNDTSPVTGAVINKLLIPNHALRNSIEDMKQDAYNKLLQQQIAASSSGMAAASSSEMAAVPSSGMVATSSSKSSDAFSNRIDTALFEKASYAFLNRTGSAPPPGEFKRMAAIPLAVPSVEWLKIQKELMRDNFLTRSSFIDFVRTMGPIKGLTYMADDIAIHPSTPLAQMCGATSISGFEKYGTMFEIALRKGSNLLSEEQAQAVGLYENPVTLEKGELREFLVKLVNQTQSSRSTAVFSSGMPAVSSSEMAAVPSSGMVAAPSSSKSSLLELARNNSEFRSWCKQCQRVERASQMSGLNVNQIAKLLADGDKFRPILTQEDKNEMADYLFTGNSFLPEWMRICLQES